MDSTWFRMIALIIHDMHIRGSVHHVASKDDFRTNLWLFPARAGALPASSCDRGGMAHRCVVSLYSFVFVLSCGTNSMLQQGCSYEKVNGEYRSACWKDQVCCNHLQPISYIFFPQPHFCDSGSCPSQAGAGKQTTGWPCQLYDLFILWCQKQDVARQNGIRSLRPSFPANQFYKVCRLLEAVLLQAIQ